LNVFGLPRVWDDINDDVTFLVSRLRISERLGDLFK
jgi:hypothetical protein